MRTRKCNLRAFTLLEVLAVLAVVSLLGALLLPALGSARRSATNARTRERFAQWVLAAESFRGEYGGYPVFHSSHLVNGGISGIEHPFHDILAGRHRDGTVLTPTDSAAAQNPRATPFHSFATNEFDATSRVCDAAGNTEIAVLVDRDLDGCVRAGVDFVALPLVGGLSPATEDFPPEGVRAGVVFYGVASAPAGTGTLVLSWK